MQKMIGIIYGTGLKETFLKETFEEEEVETEYGKATVLLGKEIVCIPRHGLQRNIPPHMINHRANFMALKSFNVETVLSTSSVGSLKKQIKLDDIIVPDDYIFLGRTLSFFDDKIRHITPGLDSILRERIIKTAKKIGIKVIPKGTYFQTYGPRLETKAEISMIKNFADVVGMNMASEATFAKELDMRYASICQVDNYAHGTVKEELDFREVMKRAEKTRSTLMKLLREVVKDLKCQS